MQNGLAKELLGSLFNFSYQPKQPKPNWTCPICKFSNYASRNACRDCGQKKSGAAKNKDGLDPKTGGTALTATQVPAKAKPAPWAREEQANQRVDELKAALAAVSPDGTLATYLKKQIEEVEKKAEKQKDKRSVLKQVEDTREFIGRAEKRHAALKEQQKQLEESIRAAEEEIIETKLRLASMEKDVVQEFTMEVPSIATNGLEDAVRSLLVMLHGAGGLPQTISTAAGQVYACLPAHAPSSDVEETAADGGMMDDSEANITAGSLDLALPGSEDGGLSDLESDEELLKWAKRQRTALHHRTRPF